MAEKKKSIIEEALLEAEVIDKTFKANAKEILTQTMSSEIEEMVKESLKGSKKALKEEENDEDVENAATDLEVSDETGEESEDLETEPEAGEEIETGEESETEEDNEDELSSLFGADETGEESETGMDDEISMDMTDDMGGVETIDLRSMDDSEVISVFKKMGPEDEIQVVQDGNTVSVKDNKTGAEYKIEMNSTSVDEPVGEITGEEGMEMDEEEVVYEIEVNDEEEMTEEDMTNEEEMEMEMDEAARTKSSVGNFRTGNRTNDTAKERMGLKKESTTPKFSKLVQENSQLKDELNKSKKEVGELREQNEKFVSALKEFRNKLHEVALFNSNLTYATRLFTENSTTKQEKLSIIERFDRCKTIKESKNLYHNIIDEINSNSEKTNIKESLDEKITKTPQSGASNVISEQSVYVHPEIEKMKKLWNYSYKK